LHVLSRSAKTDPCGRSFAVLSTKVSTAGLRATLFQQEKNNSPVVQRSRVDIFLSAQQPLTLAAMYL
jgi:hypothetical protein